MFLKNSYSRPMFDIRYDYYLSNSAKERFKKTGREESSLHIIRGIAWMPSGSRFCNTVHTVHVDYSPSILYTIVDEKV